MKSEHISPNSLEIKIKKKFSIFIGDVRVIPEVTSNVS